MTTLAEGVKATVLKEHTQTRGLSLIRVRPGDVVRIVGEDRTGLFMACRFDDCADPNSLHDAFFGLLFIDKDNIQTV